MISDRIAAEILRLAEAEKWSVGTIASQVGVHHSVVRRVLKRKLNGYHVQRARPSLLDPYMDFVRETLEKYPTLPASRLFQMVCERGFHGGPDHFRAVVSKIRPKRAAEAFMRLRTLPGEQAQVDWADFGKHEVEGTLRRLYVFVMVLSYSRKLFMRFSYGSAMGAFVRGHVGAFAYFGGVPRTVLYDNLKSAVTARVGDAVQFNPEFLELASYYRYLPKPVAVARGNEKGRVERSIQYIRTSFFPARAFTDLVDLNRQAQEWISNVADQRSCPGETHRKVFDVFEDERPSLLVLPDCPYPEEEKVVARVGKTPYVRFDLNDYSVPHTYVRKSLTVLATEETVRILNGNNVIATHQRTWGQGKQVEDDSHIKALVDIKAHARHERDLDRLHHACPSSQQLFELAAAEGANLHAMKTGLGNLLDSVGAEMLEAAIIHAIHGKTPHLRAIRRILDMHQQEHNIAPPVELHLSPRAQEMSSPIRHHELSIYDNLHCEEYNK